MKKVRRFNGTEGSDVPGLLGDEANKRFSERANAIETEENLAAEQRGENILKGMRDAEAKPPIITMDQVKKAGFSNLRDYLNDKQGLKPRGAPAADTSKAYGKEQQYQRASEAAQSPEGKAKRSAMAEAQALEGSYPVENIAGGAASLLKAGAGKLFGRGAAKEAAKQVEPYLAKEAQMALPAPAKQLALPAPARQLGYDKAAGKTASKTAERSARTQGRQDEMSRENLRRYGMTDDTSRDAVNAVRENLGMGRGFKVMKKGGSTQGYASGGKVRSASSRADGIAIRGKTRA
jgi:hypothetical protein